MDRTELGITVLGLLATFLLPWPLASGGTDSAEEAPQRVAAAPPADAQPMRVPVPRQADRAVAVIAADQPAR